MTPTDIRKIQKLSNMFFAKSEVRYIFEVGSDNDSVSAQGLYAEYPLATVHSISNSTAANLKNYVDSKGLPGIDILFIKKNTPQIINGLNTKLRTVRFLIVPCADKIYFADFRYFKKVTLETGPYCIYVNKDVAPRYLGILRKRIKSLGI